MSKNCSNFAVENEFLTCQNRVTNSHKILILNKIIADLQQVTKINSTVGLSGFESWTESWGLSQQQVLQFDLRIAVLAFFKHHSSVRADGLLRTSVNTCEAHGTSVANESDLTVL